MEAIDSELERDRPMQRLLMGEVGSGKTVVALYAMLRAVEQGAQAALMAPTELLARQHLSTIAPLAEKAGIRLCCHPDDPPFSLLGLHTEKPDQFVVRCYHPAASQAWVLDHAGTVVAELEQQFEPGFFAGPVPGRLRQPARFLPPHHHRRGGDGDAVVRAPAAGRPLPGALRGSDR